MIFGPDTLTSSFKKFIEYHFNKYEQLYKVTETSGLKYIYIENNPNIANIYKELQDDEAFSECYGFIDTYEFSKNHAFYPHDYSITWKDSNHIENTAIINELNSDEIFEATGLIIDTSEFFNKTVPDNDFVITYRYKGEDGTHVTFEYVIKKVSDDVVLAEIIITNTSLEDK